MDLFLYIMLIMGTIIASIIIGFAFGIFILAVIDFISHAVNKDWKDLL